MKTSRDICHMRVRSPVTTVTASLFPKHSVIVVQYCQLLYNSDRLFQIYDLFFIYEKIFFQNLITQLKFCCLDPPLHCRLWTSHVRCGSPSPARWAACPWCTVCCCPWWLVSTEYI